MFQSLRPNNQLYILYKDGPKLDTGTVLSVSAPTPKYPMQPMFGQPQEMVVDIIVKVNNQDITYQKIPANLDVADFGNTGIILLDNKDALNSEIMCLKQKSVDHVNSLDYHKNYIVKCDELLSMVNPDLAEKKEQKERIDALELQIAKLMDMNSQLMSRLSGETSKTENNESLGT